MVIGNKDEFICLSENKGHISQANHSAYCTWMDRLQSKGRKDTKTGRTLRSDLLGSEASNCSLDHVPSSKCRLHHQRCPGCSCLLAVILVATGTSVLEGGQIFVEVQQWNPSMVYASDITVPSLISFRTDRLCFHFLGQKANKHTCALTKANFM